MEMPLFLNESYIFHRLRMWSIVLWHSCVFGCQGALKNPFTPACEVSVFGQKEYPNFRFGPSFRSLCLSPYSVCSKRLPWKKYFHLLKSVQDIKLVLGVVYC
ncbi:BAK_1a_G0017470.mRNA.1.CDS.1 [Saccharomyces cerevisiae]|nr:BAK_1a_G0017470.mRNA.1.CDS.1 [Saccharomyces cerevisiae]CAI7110542.1 BAK_1a_G0017470.mRNA.1.CDS.1 [Saccharomyces cerevisiae]